MVGLRGNPARGTLASVKLELQHMSQMDEASGQIATAPNGAIPLASGATPPFEPSVSVWLVDDNDRFRTLVAEVLGRRDGIECARQFSSPDALLSALASKPGPDVILLDVQMGDRNGLDAVRPIKSLARLTRVLMYTTCYDQEWRERALRDGASDYLLKSDPMEKVVERIRCRTDATKSRTPIRRRPKRPVLATTARGESRRTGPPALLRGWKFLRALWN